MTDLEEKVTRLRLEVLELRSLLSIALRLGDSVLNNDVFDPKVRVTEGSIVGRMRKALKVPHA